MAGGVFAQVEVKGRHFHTLTFNLGGAPLIIIKGTRGYLACGYVDLATAETLGDACALVKGVRSLEDALDAKIVAVTEAARKLGVSEGMNAKDALEKFA